MINRLRLFLTEKKWYYFLSKSIVRVCGNASMQKGTDCKIIHSRIFLEDESSLTLGNNVTINNCQLYIKGHMTIGNNTVISNGVYNIEDGSVVIGHHSKIVAKRFWVRFGGNVVIGNYTNINDGTEVRCDEGVYVGDYNQISYYVTIWDTNTHNMLPSHERRAATEKYWPYYGKEQTRPKTKPVYIGDDCWIGEKVSILKESVIENSAIVGYGTTISNITIEKGKIAVSELKIRYL